MVVPPIPPPISWPPSSQLPWEVLLVQKPFSLSSLVPVWLSTLKILCTACLVSMRPSEQYVTVCFARLCVYCNAFILVNVCWHILVWMFVFLSVVSICCLLVCGLYSDPQSAKKIHCLQHCPVPLLECGLAQLCMADVLCVLDLIWMQQAQNCLEA